MKRRSRSRRTSSTSTHSPLTRSSRRPMAACASARSSATATSPPIPRVRKRLSACSRARCSPAPRRSCATWRPPAAILLQRTRCPYFYDTDHAVQQARARQRAAPRSAAHRIHAIVGASDACIATHPSDMAVAMRALDATVETVRANGDRRADPDRRFSPAARQHAARRDTCSPRRADHDGHAADAGRRDAPLSQGPRSRDLCVRARLGRRDRAVRTERCA